MAVNFKVPNIETIRLFGSYSRGEETQNSDYDILVVLKESKIIDESLKNQITDLFDREISVSWYSKQRIALLFRMGHLFAWHLYLESRTLGGEEDFIKVLGSPKPYSYSYEDIWSLLEILKPIKQEILKTPKNLIYEMGIIYVCARNIAICALPQLKNKYSFSVKAPFDLGLTISESDFELTMACRYASSRGLPSPNLSIDYCLNLHEEILKWGSSLLNEVENSKNYGH